MISVVNQGIGTYGRLGAKSTYVPSETMNAESRRQQRYAVQFLLNSRDLAVNLRGAAGTGKTDTLRELHRGLLGAGREVLAVAPSMTAVDELRRVGFCGAITVDRLIQDPVAQQASRSVVLIVDEAGMLSGRHMAALLAIAQRSGVRIVFSGDTRQIRSVEASDALRILERESQLKSVALTQVQRQTVRAYREAVQELRLRPKNGFAQLDAMNAVRQVPLQERAQAVERAYFEAAAQPNGKQEARSVLVIASTHEEIQGITDAIRERRKAQGELRVAVETTRHVPLNYTLAQKKDPENFRPGQVLVFHRKTKDAAKNEALEVLRVEGKQIVVSDEKGRQKRFTARQAQAFDVFHRHLLEVAVGDRLLLLANRSERNGFRATNGDLVTVSDLDEQGRIRLQDGRTLPANYRQFTHGYAVTAHRSQGKTVDAVVISGDGMERELFYVAATRAREQVAIVTTDKEALRQSIAASGDRQSATDLYKKATDPRNARSRPRGLRLAKQLVGRAARQENEEVQSFNHHERRMEVTPLAPALLQQQRKEPTPSYGI
jgi:ATP-dependent exoDNAse (exonuclease V) alpha subunit